MIKQVSHEEESLGILIKRPQINGNITNMIIVWFSVQNERIMFCTVSTLRANSPFFRLSFSRANKTSIGFTVEV